MTTRFWLRRLFVRKPAAPARRHPARCRLTLEALEDRTLLNTYFAATAADLITDIGLANAAGGANTITLSAAPSSPYTLTAVDNSTDGAIGLPVIAAGNNLTVVGNGDTIGRSTAAGTPAFRLLDVAAGATLTLQDLTLTNGLASGSGVSAQGGAIYSQGDLALNGVTVQNNTAQGVNGTPGFGWRATDGSAACGGGVYVAGGTVTLTNDTLSGNSAQGGAGGNGGTLQPGGNGGPACGGGLYVAAGTITLTNDTLSGNSAQGGGGGRGHDEIGLNDFGCPGGNGSDAFGGGVYVAGGTATLTNDTLSGNSAQGGGGGTGGTGGDPTFGRGGSGNGGNGGNASGGGLSIVSGSTVALANTLIAQDTLAAGTGGIAGGGGYKSHAGSAGSASAPDVSGSVTSSDHDLVGDGTASNLSNGVNGNQVGTSASPINPLLGPLQDNGGPTQTMALLLDSPAIDAGDSTAAGLPSTDQRGFARISGAAVDIGAFEVQEPILSPATLPDGTYAAPYSQTITATEDTGGAGGPFTLAFTAGTLPPGLSLTTQTTGLVLSGTPTAAGVYNVTVTATDGAGFSDSQTCTLTIDKADLYVTATANSKTYGETASDTGTLSGVVNGDSVTASFASAGDAAGANAGSYTITATLADPNNRLANYTVIETDAILTVSPAALTVTADKQSMTYGGSVPTLTYHYSGLVNGDTSASFTGALTTTETGGIGIGNYPISLGSLAATGNYTIVTFNGGTLTVTAAPLSATATNFSATAGASFSGTVATFTTPDKIDAAAAFTACITWGDGSTSTGVITGSNGTFTVCGNHTYAAAGSYAVCVQITNPDTQSATVNDTAKVTSLGQGVTSGMTAGIGFWQNKNRQTLIKSFNGGSSATALGNWLAASFPNLYGASAGSNCLAGKSNAQVAAHFQTLFNLGGTQAQVLAVALNVYATTSSLGGNAGPACGFTVSATGLGARSDSVGQDGAAFGVANNTVCDVYQLLVAVNKKAVNGVLYGGNTTLQAQCADLFSSLN
jgi:hypothetical protein